MILIALGLAAAAVFHASNVSSRMEAKYTEQLKAAREEGGGAKTMAPSSGSRVEGELMERVSYLEEQLTLYQTENARLLKTIDQMTADGAELPEGDGEAPPAKNEDEQAELREKVEGLTAKLRKLEFKAPVIYEMKDRDAMRKEIEARVQQQFGADDKDGKRQSRAFAAVGFIKPGTDLLTESVNLLTNQNGIAIYKGGSKVVLNKDSSSKSVHDRTALSVELTQALLDQNFGTMDMEGSSADARAAAQALQVGDANLIKVRFMLQDTFPSDDRVSDSPTAMNRQDFEIVPAFVREYFLFPYTMGMNFCQALHEKNGWESVNMAHAKPPKTTAQILHPNLYIMEREFVPVSFDIPVAKMEIKGELPLWDDTAGELGINVLLNQDQYVQEMKNLKIDKPGEMPVLSPSDFVERPGSKAAAGWRGDRCVVYSAGEGKEGQDHYAWLTAWTNAEDAIEFFNAMKASLRFRYASEVNSDAESKLFVIDGPRYVRMTRDETTNVVRVLNAGNEEWLEGLGAVFE
jgi:hypothetical protein